MNQRPIPIAVPLPRVLLALRADGRLDVIADRPCKVYLTGGLAGAGHIELPPPRVGWALVTAALGEAAEIETIARLYEGAGPADPDLTAKQRDAASPRGAARPCDTEG